jgi:ABC-type bacteriocin/lantibiotic exporter with double-glycine peptidase domain
MKNIFGFICWQWQKWEAWQKIFIFSMFAFLLGYQFEGSVRTFLAAIPLFVVISYALKWFVWDQAKENYQAYKKEKQSLFETIKTSDQQ